MSDPTALVAELRRIAKVGFGYDIDDKDRQALRGAAALIAQQAATIEAVTKERDEARKQRDREERAHLATIDQRDRAEQWADKLAQAVGGASIGEHSNLNDPWANALEISTAAEAERDRLREAGDKAYAAMRSAIALCQVEVAALADEPRERAVLRLAVFSALELPALHLGCALPAARAALSTAKERGE